LLAWNCVFEDVMEAINFHFTEDRETRIWFDLFSNNQHCASATAALDFEWWSETFQSAIAQFGHTVLILSPWNDPMPVHPDTLSLFPSK
jgi:hypothetical protein